ncbi:Hpt domain-containing protein [Shimia sp.]|uniref:Hpt domain-containing protein n=1 Tax=Shimia sp. TaxID=1954381 RepID=UPI003B8C1EA3
MSPTELQKKLAVLRQSFLSGLPDREAEIEDLAATLLEHGPQTAALEKLYFASHRLSGISDTYGFQKLGELARRSETLLEPMRHALPNRVQFDTILLATDDLSEELNQLIDAA